MKAYIGCCGIPGGLEKYSKEFKVVEINSTFYKLPKNETAKKWREIVPKNFNFIVKCHQAITHPTTSPTWKRSRIKDIEKLKEKVGFLKPTKEVFEFWNQTFEICEILASPVCLIQLPASFTETKENMENAKEFFSKIERNNMSIALELRGWSKEGFRNICEKFDLISCVDPFKEEPLWFSRKKIAYFRLHGSYEKGRINYNYKYSYKELEELKHKLDNVDANEIYCLFNNSWMKESALEFMKIWNLKM